jgi:outer membrane protein OmpA-like peptidoglycan-associated protein
MGKHVRTTGIAATLASVALAGCAYDDGTPNQPATGAIIGGLAGATAVQVLGGDTEATVIGGAVRAAIGGAVGTQMAIQERELREALAGTGAVITNTGTQLRVILSESVTFATASSVVDPSFDAALNDVSESLRRYPNSTVRVVGHTDNVGSPAYNNQLSQDRAMAVALELTKKGTPSSRMTVSGRGFYEPITSNTTAAGRAENRRVEIIITPTN